METNTTTEENITVTVARVPLGMSQANGVFHVHAPGCQDLRRYDKFDRWTIEVRNRFDVGVDTYDDHASDYDYEYGTPEYVTFINENLREFHFLPCCGL